MGLFAKFKAGLQKTQSKLAHEIKRIVTRSPKLDAAALEELEAALIAADLGMAMTSQIVGAVKQAYETQGSAGMDVFAVARQDIGKPLSVWAGVTRRVFHFPCILLLTPARPRLFSGFAANVRRRVTVFFFFRLGRYARITSVSSSKASRNVFMRSNPCP